MTQDHAEAEIWVRFAAAAMADPSLCRSTDIAAFADDMLDTFAARFEWDDDFGAWKVKPVGDANA